MHTLNKRRLYFCLNNSSLKWNTILLQTRPNRPVQHALVVDIINFPGIHPPCSNYIWPQCRSAALHSGCMWTQMIVLVVPQGCKGELLGNINQLTQICDFAVIVGHRLHTTSLHWLNIFHFFPHDNMLNLAIQQLEHQLCKLRLRHKWCW